MTEDPSPAAAGVPARPVHDPDDHPPGEGLAAGTQRSVGAGVENTPQPAPDQGDPERLVTLWSRWPGERWVIHRSHPLRYWHTSLARLSLTEDWADDRGRLHRLFEHGANPNDLEEGAGDG